MQMKKAEVVADMAWAFCRPVVVIVGGLFMLVMLMLLCMEASMLKDYWSSERVYAASAEQPDPAREGCLVRVTGPLCTDEAVYVGNLGTYTGVIEVQKHTTIAYADGLRLGGWQVQGLYDLRPSPFCWFAINTPGVKWVEAGDKKLAMLPSGTEVTLVGRQRGNVLDMVEPWAQASLGKPPLGFLDHANTSQLGDISLHSFQGIAIFAFLAYFGVWLLLGQAIRHSLLWGLLAGLILLLAGLILLIVAGTCVAVV